jgi:hypothetical protein
MCNKSDFDYSYNGQISVDEDNQIIVGQHLTQNANDKQEAEPGLEEIKQGLSQEYKNPKCGAKWCRLRIEIH